MFVCERSLLDKVGEEERGVADDAGSPRLLMLTALHGEPVVHVALRVQAGLDQDRHIQIYTFHNIITSGPTPSNL